MDLIVDMKVLSTVRLSKKCKYYFEVEKFIP